MANKQITKSYLEYLGITEITPDGRVFTKNGERKPQANKNSGRLDILLHDPEKYKATPKERRNDGSGYVHVLVYHAVYAWFKSEVPYGMEIHHKDFDKTNNHIDNLEALTPAEHRAKHKKLRGTYTSTREIKCRLDIPRAWYEAKLKELEARPDSASKQSAVYAMRAKLRYYDNHIKEVEKMTEYKKDLMELAYWKKRFKEAENKTMWRQCIKVEKAAKAANIADAQKIVSHALEVIHKTFN